MRRLVVTFVVATMLAGCGASAATPAAIVSAPSAIPTALPSASAAPAAAPTATLGASSAPATASQGGSGAFVLAGLSANVDVNGDPPDPSTFATSFASETPSIWVPYKLADGLAGKVTSTWKSSAGGDGTTISFDYPTTEEWAYFRLTYQDGFIPGDYQEILTFEPTGESVTLPFTITGPRKSPAGPSVSPSGPSAFTLLQAARTADPSQSSPDPSTYTDSFPTTAPALYVDFELRSGLTGTVTCAMTVNGSDLIDGLSIDYGPNLQWGDFKVTPAGAFPKGDYVATLTFKPTGETETVEFTVK